MNWAYRKKSKFKNVVTRCPEGWPHRSGTEAAMCIKLFERMAAGEFKSIKHEPRVKLGPKSHACIPDWSVVVAKTGETEYYEFKGNEKIGKWSKTKREWKKYGPAPMHVYKGNQSYQALSYTLPVGVPPKLPKTHEDWLRCRQCSFFVSEIMEFHKSH